MSVPAVGEGIAAEETQHLFSVSLLLPSLEATVKAIVVGWILEVGRKKKERMKKMKK